MGVISAIGQSVAENRIALSAGECGISLPHLFQSRYTNLLPCGEINIASDDLRRLLNVQDSGVTRTTLLALYAMRQALNDSKLSSKELSSGETALITGSTVGGMCHTDEFYADAQNKNEGSSYLNSYDCAATAIYLQRRYEMAGMINTINTACSSSANSIMYGARLIRTGLARRVIAGGADCLAKFTVNGFNALHILSPELCRPFDSERKGLNLGEGAAFLVMEKEEDCKGKTVYAEITGYANSNDAFHPSSLSDNAMGPYLSMKGSLESAGLLPGDINFINAHGTGTENNDLVESRAMLQLFGTPPAFASTKANVGHTLGAAGAVEAVYSILNLVHQEIYPGLRCSHSIEETGLKPATDFKKMPLNHVMSNSFGFGGNCTSLIFSKV